MTAKEYDLQPEQKQEAYEERIGELREDALHHEEKLSLQEECDLVLERKLNGQRFPFHDPYELRSAWQCGGSLEEHGVRTFSCAFFDLLVCDEQLLAVEESESQIQEFEFRKYRNEDDCFWIRKFGGEGGD